MNHLAGLFCSQFESENKEVVGLQLFRENVQ
jgi:hypothetical protein